ncbi:MAG: hypothetical protein HGA87_02025 [Desulfobulbaceae bacterium]|nr:hypothetical protein [Desulfobulbaceae bacterium]
MESKKFDRSAAFSMDIQDPDAPSDDAGIVEMLTIDGQLLILKSSAIFRGLPAETIDPKRQDLETRHSYEKLYPVGLSNSYVARMVIQFKEIIPLVVQNAGLQDQLLCHVWKANKILLECEAAHYAIYKQAQELIPKCDVIIASNKAKAAISALPKVDELNKHVDHFLNNGKQFLIATFEILHIMYQMPFTGRTNTHFDEHREWIKNKFGSDDPIYKLLDQDKEWIKRIAELRNAIQHPESGQQVEVQNIALKPGNKFSAPVWRYDLTKKGLGRQDEFTDLIMDLNGSLCGLLTLFEELLIVCLKRDLDNSRSFLDIYKKIEEDVDRKRPVVYFVQKRESGGLLKD